MFTEAGQKLAMHVCKWSSALAGVEPSPAEILAFALAPPSPNPGAAATRIDFTLPERRDVQLAIIDAGGRRVATLASGPLDAGRHSLAWDGTLESGPRAAAGVYWAVLTAGGQRLERRLVRLR
jgi:hypothetical protein